MMFTYFLILSRGMAWAGGAVLSIVIIMVCASIAGGIINGWMYHIISLDIATDLAMRVLASGVGPIKGDFELTEAGVAFAIFAFLPYCQVTDGHARVDIFTRSMSAAVNRLLRLLADGVFAAVMVLIAVQLYAGLQSKMASGQTTFLLEFPLWWAYAMSLSGAAVSACVAVCVALLRLQEVVTGRPLPAELTSQTGSDH